MSVSREQDTVPRVVRGSISQFHESFPAKQRGAQCTAISTASCCKLLASAATGPGRWTPDDVDECLRVGAALYSDVVARRQARARVDTGPDEYLSIDNIHHVADHVVASFPLTHGQLQFRVDLESRRYGNLRGSDGLPDLSSCLGSIYEKYKATLLIINGFTVAVYHQSISKVWLLDSHDRGPDGLHLEGGTAVLMRFDGLPQLSEHFCRLFPRATGRQADFEAAPVYLVNPPAGIDAGIIMDTMEGSMEDSRESGIADSMEVNTSWSSRASSSCFPPTDVFWNTKDRSLYGPELAGPHTDCSMLTAAMELAFGPSSASRLYSDVVRHGRRPATAEAVPPTPSPPSQREEWPLLPGQVTPPSTTTPSPPMSPWPWRGDHFLWGVPRSIPRETVLDHALAFLVEANLTCREDLDDVSEADLSLDVHSDNLSFLDDARLTCADLESERPTAGSIVEVESDTLDCSKPSLDLSIGTIVSNPDSSSSPKPKYLSAKDKKRIQAEKARERAKRRRLNEDYSKQEAVKNAEAMRARRQNPDYCANDADRNAERIRDFRQDQEYRRQEALINAERNQALRSDPEYRRQEALMNAERNQALRSDPEYRRQEALMNAERNQALRSDPEYHRQEALVNAERNQALRSDPEYRRQEALVNAERNQALRSDPEYHRQEALVNAERNQALRCDPEYHRQEALVNAERNRVLREDEDYRSHENSMRAVHREEMQAYEAKKEKYWQTIQEGPTWICCCCGQLWFRKSIVVHSESSLASKNNFYPQWREVSVCRDEASDEYYFCSTCFRHLSKNKLPTVALVNGLELPNIPEELAGLSPLEERLVSARIPFMMIRTLGVDRQFGLKGSCVNVPVDVNTSVSALPRMPSDAHVVHVQIMRRMMDNRPYAFDSVRPNVVLRAARALTQLPLYQKHGIALNENWLQDFMDEMGHARSDAVDDPPVGEQVTVEDTPEAAGETAGEEAVDDPVEDAVEVVQGAAVEDDEWIEDEDEETRMFAQEETLLDEVFIPDVDTGIRIAPGEGRVPISLLFDADVEELSFPTQFAGRVSEFRSKPSMVEVTKSRGRLYNRRFARNFPHSAFSFSRLRRNKLARHISLAIRKKRADRGVTVRDALSEGAVDNLVQHNDGYRILAVDRSSPAFWSKEKKKVMAMMRQFGSANIFLTWSCAEFRWWELLIILKKNVDGEDVTKEDVENLPWQEKTRLVQQDPYTVSRYCNEKLQELWKLIHTKGGPLKQYTITHSFSRIEFQHRGSEHMHSILWLDGAPVFDENDPESWEKVTEFVDEFITCFEDPEIKEFINVQYHKHNRTCKKEVRGQRFCRFNVPWAPMRRTRILFPLDSDMDPLEKKRYCDLFNTNQDKILKLHKERKNLSFDELLEKLECSEEDYLLALRSQLKRPKIFLKRNLTEIKLNAYNKEMLILLNANMDIQFILDPYACIVYIVDYVGKSQRGLSELIKETADRVREGDTSLSEQLRAIANVFINKSEVSAREIAYHNLCMPLARCSEKEIYINTSPVEERTRLLKSEQELRRILDGNPESTDIFVEGLFDHYVQRPQTDEFQNLCLADFAAWYEYSKSKRAQQQRDAEANPDDLHDDIVEEAEAEAPANSVRLLDGSGFIRKRTKPKVIRYRNYSAAKDPHNFMREQLLLFSAWIVEDSITNNVRALYDSSLDVIRVNRDKYVKLNIDLDEVLQEVLRENYEDEVDQDEGQAVPEEFAVFEVGPEGADIAQDVAPDVMYVGDKATAARFLLPRHQPQEEYLAAVARLNDKQRWYHDNLMHLMKTQPNTQVLNFVSGGAGVGKSTLIKAITQSAIRVHLQHGGNPDDLVVALMGPTGRASFLIGGVTLHSAFQIFNQNEENTLGPDNLNTLRAELRHTKLFVIDEVSMVGAKMLAKIDGRLKQIFANRQPFGGASVIVFGDLNQLRPIGDNWIFQSAGDDLSVLAGPALWRLFKHFALTEIMRQRDDARLAEALNRLADGSTTVEDDAMFSGREVRRLRAEGVVPPESAAHLFEWNDNVNAFNSEFLNSLDTPSCESPAADHCEGEGSAATRRKQLDKVLTLKMKDTQNLPTLLLAKVQAPYMVTVNLNTQDGLTNGAIGDLVKIVMGRTAANESVPLRLYLFFDNEDIGKQCRADNRAVIVRDGAELTWTPITRTSRSIIPTKGSKFTVVRKQFPMVPAKAITVHKSQGGTFPGGVVVHIMVSRKMQRCAMYVGFTRVTSLSGLFIDGVYTRPNPPAPDDPVVLEHRRLKAPENLVQFVLAFPDVCAAEGGSVALFHNIRSLNKHHANVVKMKSYTSCDILMFCETWTLPDDNIDIEGFTVMHRRDCVRARRHPYGTVLYVRNSLADNVNVVFGQEETFTAFRGNELRSFLDVVGFVITKDGTKKGVVFLHKSPKCNISTLLNLLQQCLDCLTAQEVASITVVGDFNINLQDNMSKSLTEFMAQKALLNCVEEGEVSTDYGTLIDLCYSDVHGLSCKITESAFSDHKPLWFQM